MNLSLKIAPHITQLRRFSRELTGDRTSGDAYVAVLLESIIAEPAKFDDAADVRVALYQRFCHLWESIPFTAHMQLSAGAYAPMSPKAREAFLLMQLEGLATRQISQILSCDPDVVAELISEASDALPVQINRDLPSKVNAGRNGSERHRGFAQSAYRPHRAVGEPGNDADFKQEPMAAASANWNIQISKLPNKKPVEASGSTSAT
ncbi:MAG: hypothetical protein WCC66_08600 [Rhizobiaceae bacterium]